MRAERFTEALAYRAEGPCWSPSWGGFAGSTCSPGTSFLSKPTTARGASHGRTRPRQKECGSGPLRTGKSCAIGIDQETSVLTLGSR